MKKYFDDIIKLFKDISSKGYVKAINNNPYNSCGLTFEHLLNINPNSSIFPDYKEIEIKTSTRFSNFPVSLFSSTFIGYHEYESDYILNNYGIYDKVYKDKKIFNIALKYNKPVEYGNHYFELRILDDGIATYVYNQDNILIDKIGYIDFDTIRTRAEIKVKKMVLIKASKKKENNDLYYRYYQIDCYILKEFENFIDAIKSGDLKISVSLRFDRSSNLLGKNRNKGLIFSIRKDGISSIFKLINSKNN